ncbi:MAG TPA: hypothetical protein VIL20_06645 [Sandaracinaceae bacterium]
MALCKDSRTVAFCDSRFDDATLETAARMMRALWPGWTVRPVRYVSEVAATLGVDLVTNAAPSPTAIYARPAALARVGVLDGELPRAGLVHLRDAEGERTLLSNKPLVPLLRQGPGLLEVLPRLPSIPEVRRALASRSDERGRPKTLLESHPGGALCLLAVDALERTLRVTILPDPSAVSELAALSDLEARWPGWKVSAQIASPEAHFQALGLEPPPDLLPVPESPPRSDQLRWLADALLGDDEFKRWARGWLGRVATGIGLAPEDFSERGPVLHDLSAEERRARFGAAVAALGLPDDEVRAALEYTPRPQVPGDDERAIAVLPSREEAFAWLCHLELQGSDTEAALEVLSRWKAAQPENAKPRVQRCELLFELERFEEARAEAQALCDSHPDRHHGWVQLARLALRAGDREGALEHLRRAYERFDPRTAQGYLADDEFERYEELAELLDEVAN